MELESIKIPLDNGMYLIVERNTDPNFSKELFIGIGDGQLWYQDLAIVRPAYEIQEDLSTKWNGEKFDVLVYADKDQEDYTHEFHVDLYHGGI